MTGSFDDAEELYITIDDIKYIMLPESVWTIQPGSEVIGYAGSRDIEIIEAEGDTERNFIFLNDRNNFSFELCLAILHRTDIPEPSSNIISRIDYYENNYTGNDIVEVRNTVTDQELIFELFNLLESSQKTTLVSRLDSFTIVFNCYADAVPGAVYSLGIRKSGEKLMCGNSEEGGYVELPIELLEEMAGHEFNINDLFR